MTPAAKLQEHLKKRVQGSGGQYRKVRWEGRRGCPDCFIWWTWPHAAFVEIKAERDVLSAIQRRGVERMREDGVPVYIASTVDDLEKIIEEVRKGLAS